MVFHRASFFYSWLFVLLLIFLTVRSFRGTVVMELYMRGTVPSHLSSFAFTMHVQFYHRSAKEATQRPKDEKQQTARRILVSLCCKVEIRKISALFKACFQGFSGGGAGFLKGSFSRGQGRHNFRTEWLISFMSISKPIRIRPLPTE